MHSAGRIPAVSFSRLQGCGAWGPAGFDILRAAVRQPAHASCLAAARGGLAAFDNTAFCTLRAAVWQPASAGCLAAARGGFAGSDDTMFFHLLAAVRQSDSAGCWRLPPTIWPFPRPRTGSQPPIRANNPSHWPNVYTCSSLWRIHPQPCLAAFILSAAID
jgi:hypothetical protein